jgi:hypothetical protein
VDKKHIMVGGYNACVSHFHRYFPSIRLAEIFRAIFQEKCRLIRTSVNTVVGYIFERVIVCASGWCRSCPDVTTNTCILQNLHSYENDVYSY